MNSNSFRREFLDSCLNKNRHLLRGNVLDLGGKKNNRRGNFIPPIDQVESWKFLNNDIDTNPDYCCDIENIPLDETSIDIVIMTEVLEYLANPNKVFSEIFRVLKINGHVLVSVPFLNPVHGDHWADRVRYSSIALKEFAECAGFEVKSIEPMGSLGSVIYDILRVAGGYASKNKRTIGGFLLRFFRPFFLIIDKFCNSQKDFINTGYFIILKK
jgi:SAM-dependent methyltransferase